MMPILRKVLVVALFVLLSAVLFTVLLSPVFNVLAAFYGYAYQSSPAATHEGGFDLQPVPTAVHPFSTAQEFFMVSWVSITAGLSLSVTAIMFLLARASGIKCARFLGLW